MTALDHERVTLGAGRRSGLTVIVAVHSTVLGQAVGGCRLWRYPGWSDGLDDALRLSSAMTLKCALAGLPLGGGKSVIALPLDLELTPALRRDVMLDLGDVIDSLGGTYGVGEDVGTTAEDMLVVRERTRYAYGLPVASGGIGESSEPTAIGIYESIKVTAEKLYGTADLAGRTFTVIGLGQVGYRLAERLAGDGAKLAVTDIDSARQEFAHGIGAEWVDASTALTQECDFLIPCALGGQLSRESVPTLRCRAIVGAANNQLATDDVDTLLAERGILWAPDFLVNAGGVVYGSVRELNGATHEQALLPVMAIAETLRQVFDRAEMTGTTPLVAAAAIANDRIAAARVR